jgi:hypothetical protein
MLFSHDKPIRVRIERATGHLLELYHNSMKN